MWVFRQIATYKNNMPTKITNRGANLYFREGVHTFGRQASKCSVLLQGDQQVSREHATVNVIYTNVKGQEAGIFIRDGTENKARSSSGTYVNETKIAQISATVLAV